MKKGFYRLYAIICYLIFFGTFLYFIGFVANLFVPRSLDAAGESRFPLYIAILINAGLISIFGLQHSIMARQGFKKRWTRLVPEAVERSTYVLFASIVVVLLVFFWQPVPYVMWDLSDTLAGDTLKIIAFVGWGLILVSTYLINHFHLFGLQQAFSREQAALPFRTPFLYKLVRHPLYLGFLIAFWAAPVMTAGHLLFSLGMSLYIFIGIHHEEKDLTKLYGTDYERYRQRTPKILPFIRVPHL
jgi:protein-S-isoprenylcysteine O-methyltransferase Ste14